MDRLLSFLLFAAFFYLMMRFGCGAHMVHGNHSTHEHEEQYPDKEAERPAVDPVCGLLVGAGQGYAKHYQGKTIHFCSRECLDKFDSEPQRYAA